MEIMKITGTPTKEFTAKLQSEDVRSIDFLNQTSLLKTY